MKPIDVLKGGLKKLQDQTQARKAGLEARLKASQPILQADKEWLDGDGSLVDEQCLLDKLDKASDYNCAIEKLDAKERSIVQKLMGLMGHGNKMVAPLKKRKCMVFIFIFE